MSFLFFIIEKGVKKTLDNAIAVSLKSNDIAAREEFTKWVTDYMAENFYRYEPKEIIQCRSILNTYFAIDRLFDWYESPVRSHLSICHTDVTDFCNEAISNYIYNRDKKFKKVIEYKKRPVKRSKINSLH